MEELAKSDIFFVITAVAVIVLTILLIVTFFFLIRILKNIRDLSGKVKDEGERIIEDVAFVRKGFEKSGNKVAKIIKDNINKHGGKEKS